jgi:C1A family cysteine protease
MLAKVCFGAALLTACVTAENDDHPFGKFVKQFERKYANHDEEAYRRTVFYKNLEWINAENAKGKPYTLGVTQFADLTFDEFRAQYLTGYNPTTKDASLGVFQAPADFVEADSVDWSTQGAVTDVKNQGHCGSCWSFSTTGALEGAMKIAGHDLVSLSEQNILDCDNGWFGGHKCRGGSMAQAFGWVAQNGICSEADDAYKCMN